jgi:hypothetical protein
MLSSRRAVSVSAPITKAAAVWAAAVWALALAAAAVCAGPLTPPAGPVTSTNKTLVEVEPRTAISATNTPGDANSVFRISFPGSYYLTDDVVGVSGKHGIKITASNVTLDLNGFTLDGQGNIGSLDGITNDGTRANITVRNGSVVRWGNSGVDLPTSIAAVGRRIERIDAQFNLQDGISAGDNAVVQSCTAHSNAGNGFQLGASAVVTGCSAFDNGARGFGTGITASLTDCVARDNGNIGFTTSTGSVLTGCLAASNASVGFSLGNNTVVTNCSARSNTQSGINVGTASSVIDCLAVSNAQNGISFGSGSVIRGNIVRSNTLVGLLTFSNGSRIEGNVSTFNDVGLSVQSAGNIIVRNQCGQNTTNNWLLDAGNHYGPIIDRTAILPAAVTGNSAAAALGSTDPNANYTTP